MTSKSLFAFLCCLLLVSCASPAARPVHRVVGTAIGNVTIASMQCQADTMTFDPPISGVSGSVFAIDFENCTVKVIK